METFSPFADFTFPQPFSPSGPSQKRVSLLPSPRLVLLLGHPKLRTISLFPPLPCTRSRGARLWNFFVHFSVLDGFSLRQPVNPFPLIGIPSSNGQSLPPRTFLLASVSNLSFPNQHTAQSTFSPAHTFFVSFLSREVPIYLCTPAVRFLSHPVSTGCLLVRFPLNKNTSPLFFFR